MALSWWKKGLWQIVMHHWTVHAKEEFQNFLILGQGGSFHNFDPKLRNERFTLISFVQFLAILSALQSFQICIFDRKNSISTFSNSPQLMEKRFMANLSCIIGQYMQKKNFKTFSCWRGVHSTTFDP